MLIEPPSAGYQQLALVDVAAAAAAGSVLERHEIVVLSTSTRPANGWRSGATMARPAVTPYLALPELQGYGSAAMVINVSAPALNRMS